VNDLKVEQNSHGQMIVSRSGRLLCSFRDPLREAQSWLSRQKIDSFDRQVLVLGYGAGHHICLLEQTFPTMKIFILELDDRLHSKDRHFLSEAATSAYDAVLAFKPAWAGFEELYLNQYLKLTGRDQKMSQVFLEKIQFRLPKSEILDGDEEVKIWQCLRELVK
jgi:hypothetical protein